MGVNTLFKNNFPKLANQFELKSFQQEVISQVQTGRNTLCIMPTGGGKSLIYWLSGLSLGGITLVISPLTALIDEQAAKLEEQGIEVLVFHSGINSTKQVELLKEFYNHQLNPKFIFASPERISTDGFFEHCMKARKDELKMVAIDEIHCVSQWGHSFRPFYQHIPKFLNRVYHDKWPTILGLSATLNEKEIKDACQEFKIDYNAVIKNELLIRNEIELKTFKFTKEDEKLDKLWQLLQIHAHEKVLIYVYRVEGKNSTVDLAKQAAQKGFKATYFHGELTAKEKQNIIEQFKNNELHVVFATNAFGMGIDIPDIRVVIHFMIPESIAQYYQEVGRASRDKLASNAYLFYTNKNIEVKKSHFIDKSFPKEDELIEAFNKLTSNKIGLKALPYYDDEQIQKCLQYFIDIGIIELKTKSMLNLNIFKDVINDDLQRLIDSTKTKNIITTLKKNSLPIQDISDTIFHAIANDEVKLAKTIGKCIIVENYVEQLTKQHLDDIEKIISEKRTYKHAHLNYLVYLLNHYENSRELHQEIGRHLGVPKFHLNKIYATTKGDLVRSKSEVIIANLLHQHNLQYDYEKEVFIGNKKFSPDFTIYHKGETYYWEHLGMIGIEDYDSRWIQKLNLYNKYYPNKLITTFENPSLSNSVIGKMNEYFK